MAIKSSKTDKFSSSLFCYQAGNSFLHNLDAWKKLIFLFIASVGSFYLSFSISIVIIFLLLFCFLTTKLSFKNMIKDLSPVLYYAFLLYTTTAITNRNFAIQFADIVLLLRLTIMMQISSLLFRTTTSLQLKSGLETIESAIRKVLHLKQKTTFSQTFSFFLLFLPRTFEIWNNISRAWAARGGKNNIKKIFTLMPILLSLSIHKAWLTARAAQNRS